MKDLSEIVLLIESLSIDKYGSVNKMLKDNDISKSAVDNMKKNPPSIPNIISFSKIADALEVTVDYLLNGCSEEKTNSYDDQNPVPKLSFDERTLIESYKELDDEGKYLVQDNLKRVWAKHSKTSTKDAAILESSNSSKIG